MYDAYAHAAHDFEIEQKHIQHIRFEVGNKLKVTKFVVHTLRQFAYQCGVASTEVYDRIDNKKRRISQVIVKNSLDIFWSEYFIDGK